MQPEPTSTIQAATETPLQPNQTNPSSETAPWFNWLVNGSSLLLFAAITLIAWLEPAQFARLIVSDRAPDGPGAFEHLTVIALIPAVLFGIYAFRRHRTRVPHPILAYWILGWSLACLFFLGEEISWGQWYFHWSSPEPFVELNRQSETNLHNLSSWFNQKPRFLVESFLILFGFLVPLWRLVTSQRKLFRNESIAKVEGWIYAPTALLVPALLCLVTRMVRDLNQPFLQALGNGELREFLIAWFLMWYVISYTQRLACRISERGLRIPEKEAISDKPSFPY